MPMSARGLVAEHAVAQEALRRGVQREEPRVGGVEVVHRVDDDLDALCGKLAQRGEHRRPWAVSPAGPELISVKRAEGLGRRSTPRGDRGRRSCGRRGARVPRAGRRRRRAGRGEHLDA
jgi:hypothetical protein